MRHKLFLVAIVMVFASTSQAQPWGSADTIQARMLTVVLPDSTLIRYELGNIRQHSSDGYRFATFEDSSGTPYLNYLRSKPFALRSSSDTIAISRFVGYDDASIMKHPTQFNSEAEATAYADSSITYYTNRSFIPSNSYFGASSNILFIAKLKRASNNTVIKILDTLRCYRNSEGELRYRTPGRTSSWAIKVVDGDSGTSAYIQVDMESNLPSGTTISSYGMENLHDIELSHTKGITPIWQEIPEPAPKYNRPLQPGKQALSLAVTQLFPNPTKKSVQLGIQSPGTGEVSLTIVNTLGTAVWWRSESLMSGYNLLTLTELGLPAGSYHLLIQSANEIISKPFTILPE